MSGGGYGGTFAFIVVIFVLLVIVGCSCWGGY
ncbi:YjcZ family sporulation protein [Peribacillus glennii]|uniref:YjcZ family sporulation protein n=1 Tax=Peribacillus glennii TaxID=2303991 RepID=A0A372LG25_9BACI|nr:YjcZ family sporulation protein [Peribacillus glennii]RFU65217.1 YjcZ family sporulation protein [Peribacillus glennii]